MVNAFMAGNLGECIESNARPGPGSLRLQSVTTLREVRFFLHLLGRLDRLFVLCQLTTNRTRFLATKVQWNVLLATESSTELNLLVLVVHREDTGDRLAYHANLAQLGSSAANGFRHAQLSQLLLVVVQLTEQLRLALGTKLVRFNLDCKHNSGNWSAHVTMIVKRDE